MNVPRITDNQEIIAFLGVSGIVAMCIGQTSIAMFLFGGMLTAVNPSPKGHPTQPPEN